MTQDIQPGKRYEPCGCPKGYCNCDHAPSSGWGERVYVFVAYQDKVPFFSALFDDHTQLKIFSGEHSFKHKKQGYSSTYFELTDKSFLVSEIAKTKAEIREKLPGEESRYKGVKVREQDEYYFAGREDGHNAYREAALRVIDEMP